MPVSDTALALIQVIAFFLPAWAIMVQLFSRFMERADLDKTPDLIPLFGAGFAFSLLSLYLFNLSAMSTLVNMMLESTLEGSSSSLLLLRAARDLVKGGFAFGALGLIVLVIASVVSFTRENGIHVAVFAILIYAIMTVSVEGLNPAIQVALVISLFVVDLVFIRSYWEQVKPYLGGQGSG